VSFERIGSREIWSGRIASVREDRFRYDDGDEADREIVSHPGSVAVVAHDGEHVYLVAQPREAVDEKELLELPAGKLDEEGESPLETGKRELAEEIGKGAKTWTYLTTCYSSPGFSDEEIHLYMATDLYDEHAETDENERIEVRPVPLAELGAAIREIRDAKTLVGLLWLEAFGEGGGG
jgi:8-oxo-dGTP pyrophosphatase MutT (NUDIX family)